MYNNQIKKIKFLEQIFSVKNEIECKNKLKEIEYKNFNMHRVSTPMPFCSYCKINCQQNDIDWAVSEKQLKEWI